MFAFTFQFKPTTVAFFLKLKQNNCSTCIILFFSAHSLPASLLVYSFYFSLSSRYRLSNKQIKNNNPKLKRKSLAAV